MEAQAEAATNLINILEGTKTALIHQGRLSFHLRTPHLHLHHLERAKKLEKDQKSSKSEPNSKPEPNPHSNIQSKEEDDALSDTKPKKKTKEDEATKLETVAKKAHETLLKQDTVFPFTLFPDTIIVEREKVNIAKRFFFRVAKITHIPVRDLLHVDADIGPFFGSVHITSRFFTDKPFEINYLWREDALRIQRLLQGYIIAHEREIDCTSIEKNKLVELLNDLGGGETK